MINNEQKEKMISAVTEAGKFILGAHDIEKGIHIKPGDVNFATEWDIKTQELLIKTLGEIVPEAGFLAEEEGLDRADVGEDGGLFFVIDPIDGTTNFLHGLCHSAVSAALCDGDGAVVGCVCNPYLDEMFYASRGEGAYLIRGGKRTKLSVSGRGIRDALVAFGTAPYERKYADDTFALVKAFFLSTREVRREGSAALDICYVAAGRYDVFFEMILSPWDFAAAGLILREAGGIISSLKGEQLPTTGKCSVIAANGVSYDDALETVRRTIYEK